eukprot:5732060-Pyramimonas_sp.AAC.1
MTPACLKVVSLQGVSTIQLPSRCLIARVDAVLPHLLRSLPLADRLLHLPLERCGRRRARAGCSARGLRRR